MALFSFWPLVMLVVAVCISLVGRLIRPRTQNQLSMDEVPTIFVAIIAYCDQNWVEYVLNLMETARQPARLFFGVVEYVEKADQSREDDVPPDLRSRVRVHAMSKRVATSQREAREFCFNELFRDESFVLFSRSIVPISGWDDALIEMLAPSTVISCKITTTIDVVFPCIVSGRDIVYRPLVVSGKKPIPSLLWIDDLSFSTPDAVPLILSSSNLWDVTAALNKAELAVVMPGYGLAIRSVHPRGVKTAERNLSLEGKAYARSVGVRKNRAKPFAQLGLTPNAEAYETIGKCGSLVAARVELQTIEAEGKHR